MPSHNTPVIPDVQRRNRTLVAAGCAAMSLLLACTSAHASSRYAGTVKIDGSVTLIVSSRAPGPVRRAAEDLRSDFSKVFGSSPALASSMNNPGPVSVLIALSNDVPAGVKCSTATDVESFAFSVSALRGHGASKRVVCLVGADMRGTIFAIYEFSRLYLGTDPMYLWTDKMPAKQSSIALPADFDRVYPKPVFRYRGFFPNDEDLLTGWIPSAAGEQTGISPKTWDMVFETILRLKGNMVAPGTWIFPDDEQVHQAAERGLIVNQHHATPLGVNVARWPKDVPYTFSTHPEILERAWTNAVAEYKAEDEILWTVGLRGLSDSSYASLDPSVRNNDPLLAQRVSEAIVEQMKIVRAKYPNAQFITNLWQEGDRLMREGYLKIPPEVKLVWADTGYGDMQDGGRVAAGQGAYFHVAMMNGQANQLSEMVPVAIIQSELGRYIQAGATNYILVNTSDIRPVAMTTRALMDIAWGGVPKGPHADADFYRDWAAEEFGPKSADDVAAVYKEYFAAASLRHGPSEAESNVPIEYGDQHYHTEIRRILLETLSQNQVATMPSQSPKWTLPGLLQSADAKTRRAALDRDIQECKDAQPRWDAVWNHAVAAQRLIDPDRADYYQEAVLTMITINQESNRSLMLVAQAVEHAEAAEMDKARGEIAQALEALNAIQQSMQKAEYGKWKNWYRGDWLTGIYRTRQLVQSYADHLRDPLARLPAPVAWNGWEAYFHIMRYEGDRTVDVR